MKIELLTDRYAMRIDYGQSHKDFSKCLSEMHELVKNITQAGLQVTPKEETLSYITCWKNETVVARVDITGISRGRKKRALDNLQKFHPGCVIGKFTAFVSPAPAVTFI
ncbi:MULTISPECIES: hypothetical protein [Sphingobacterium]|uniref:hypothetical protein n=1 Tax=Sphingobacterium TaxID=28453 RepID=UPI00129CFA27|nr:hypothetical protein [Sphingobacterium paramultivorum]